MRKAVYEEIIAKFGAGVKKIHVGDGMDPKTHVGPSVTKQQQERVLYYIRKVVDAGAKLAFQGDLPTEEKCKNGVLSSQRFSEMSVAI